MKPPLPNASAKHSVSPNTNGRSSIQPRYLTVKNWSEFQHYRKRNPPWIKLHRALLDDYEFNSLTDAQKGHLVLLWLYASQNNGKIPFDPSFLERKLSVNDLQVSVFIDLGFLIEEQDLGPAGRKA